MSVQPTSGRIYGLLSEALALLDASEVAFEGDITIETLNGEPPARFEVMYYPEDEIHYATAVAS